jgi:hypothetical protein
MWLFFLPKSTWWSLRFLRVLYHQNALDRLYIHDFQRQKRAKVDNNPINIHIWIHQKNKTVLAGRNKGFWLVKISTNQNWAKIFRKKIISSNSEVIKSNFEFGIYLGCQRKRTVGLTNFVWIFEKLKTKIFCRILRYPIAYQMYKLPKNHKFYPRCAS